MTPPARPTELPPPVEEHVVRVRDLGELVAAVPAMLGFHPRESLVLMAIGGRSGRRLGLTMRLDLPPPEHQGYADDVEQVVAAAMRGLRLDRPDGAVAVVVSGGGPPRTAPPDPLPHRLLAERVARALADEEHLSLRGLLWAEHTGGGAHWACYARCGCTGRVPDPTSTPLVAALVTEGRVVHTDRAALDALVAPAEPARVRRRESLLIRITDGDTTVGGSETVGDGAAGLRALHAALADAAAGRLALADPDADTRVVTLATALGLPEVRASALRRCADEHAVAAERLWTALTREAPDPEAAEPATLLAVSALLRGDGAFANAALDRAGRAWPGHAFAGLVRGAAAAGLRPVQVRELLCGGASAQGSE